MAVRLRALRAGRSVPPGRLLVLIYVRGSVDPRGLSNDFIGNRPRDFSAYCVVSQPTRPDEFPDQQKKEREKGKPITLISRGGPWISETSRLPYFLEIRLTDGGMVVSLTHRPLFTTQEDS
jgi:hypothetical protein